MFLKHDDAPEYADLSSDVRDTTDWKIGALREFEFPQDISSVAIDPLLGLLAIGTTGGIIYIHGGPSVESKLQLPENDHVRFLQFASLTEKLVCLDGCNFMHVWDLSPLGSPKRLATVRWDPVTFMILSPSHDHIFLAMGNGDLRTYDVACMRKSPYTIHNKWRLYEEQRLQTGLSPVPFDNPRSQVVEILPHPRDLALVFIAYEAGVVLLDLKERNSVHTYELIYPPGAPGGAGYLSQDILTARRPSITSIAIHPAGHFFVTGHVDGALAFWAVENADQPILVRTLEDLDVNLVDTGMLDTRLSEAKPPGHGSNPREPIYKITWSGFSNSKDPRGGETALTILGGFSRGNEPGLTTLWFPAFNPSDPPSDSTSSTTQSQLHPFMVDAIRQSLTEKHSYVYSTDTPVQDFYLVPRNSPHFNYSYDAHTILMLVETVHDERALISREFPPPVFFTQGQQLIQAKEARTDKSDLDDLDDVLQSLSIVDSPQSTGLPYGLYGAGFSADTYQMHVLPKEFYPIYVKDNHTSTKKPRIGLSGGMAQMEPFSEAKRKYQPYRIAIFATRELTVHFYNFSDQLLQEADGASLKHDFPEALDELEIDLRPVLSLIDSEQYPHEGHRQVKAITATQLAVGSMECAIVLSTGELFVYRSKSSQTARGTSGFQDNELKSLTHISVEPWKSFVPYFALIAPERGAVDSIAISEIGFVAASFSGGSLLIVDMRGPDVLYRSTKSGKSSRRLSRLSFSHIPEINTVASGVTSLTWVISRTDKDPKACIRLLALQPSGDMNVYTVSHSRAGFTVEDPITVNKVIADPLRGGIFVVNSKSGSICKADKGRFADIVHFSGGESEPVVLITAGAKSVRSFSNITGERVGKADWHSKYGKVIGAQIVERLGSMAFVAYTDKSALHIYSLPHLEHILTIPALSTPLRSISIDENGDFISLKSDPSSGSVRSAIYGTLFNFRRIDELPVLDLVTTKNPVPTQPQPVPMGPSSYLSWFSSKQSMSGSQIDELLGGPDRPQPVKRARDIIPKKEEAASEPSSIISTATATQSTIYNRLASALEERGQMLGELEENFRSLEQSSKDMVAHAKMLAAKNTAKSWFKF